MYPKWKWRLAVFACTLLTTTVFLMSGKEGIADAATCSPYKTKAYMNYDYLQDNRTTKMNQQFSYPDTPVLRGDVHDRSLHAGDFYTSYYQETYYTENYRRNYQQQVYYDYYCNSYGNHYYAGNSYGAREYTTSWYVYENVYQSAWHSASMSVTKTGGSASQGYESFTATASGRGKTSSSSNHKSYYVNKVDVSVSQAKTYEDEDFPTVTCTKYYGWQVGDNHAVDCKSGLRATDDNSQSIRTICYYYTENGHRDDACTERVYVKDIDLTGPDTVYTGQHHTYQCYANFYDGLRKPIHGTAKTLTSTPYSYIGSDWYNKGYSTVDNKKTIRPNHYYDFYSADNYDRTYTVACSYFKGIGTVAPGVLNKTDNAPAKKATKQVKHVGIQNVLIDSKGYFSDGGNEYTFVSKVNKTSDRQGAVTDVAYITGHWYDFEATLLYTDGTKRDVTNAPETYWTQTPWYSGQTPYNKKHSFDTRMPESGLNHRIAADGTNTITAEYFNRNVPYGGNASNTFSNALASRNYLTLKSRQISKLEIRDGSGYDTPAKTTVQAGDEASYSAWITWTDGVREDWTDTVTWKGEYYTDVPGSYHFRFKSNNNKTSVTAFYGDTSDAGLIDEDDWDSSYDKIEVTLQFDCSTITSLTWGCAIPTGNWQTEPGKHFESKADNINFLPPPEVFGLEAHSWTEGDGYRKEYPYNFEFDFNVSGISEGSGNK